MKLPTRAAPVDPMNANTHGRHHRDLAADFPDWLWTRLIHTGHEPSRGAHRERPGRWTFSDWQQVTR